MTNLSFVHKYKVVIDVLTSYVYTGRILEYYTNSSVDTLKINMYIYVIALSIYKPITSYVWLDITFINATSMYTCI